MTTILTAMVGLSTDFLVQPNTVTDIPFDTVIDDVSGLFNPQVGNLFPTPVANIGGFVVPTGITHLRASFVTAYDANSTGTFRGTLAKFNAQAVIGALGMPRSILFINNDNVSFDIGGIGSWKPAVAGDYISLRAFHDASIALNVRAILSWFGVEMR